MSSNRRLSAAEALEWGLVSEVIPADDFEARVAELAAEWAARADAAIGRTKQLFEHACDAALEAQLALEAELQQESVGDARTSPRASTPSSRSARRSSPAPEPSRDAAPRVTSRPSTTTRAASRSGS